jgi:hypothetical protein
MRLKNIAVSLMLVLLLVASVVAQSPNEPLAITISPSSDGISSGSDELKAGADVRVIVTLTNQSDRDITLRFTSPMCDYAVEVRNIAGELAQDTEQKRTANCVSRLTGRNFSKVLKPNQSAKDGIDISLVSDMSQPGEYSVQVMRKAPKEFGEPTVKSNTIKMTLTP